MIVNDHLASYARLVPWLKPNMLMLGAQRNTSSFRFPCEYQTLDPDGGDFPLDLSNDEFHRPEMAFIERHFVTVFDLGTLEHIWDTHAAYVNAARMVAFGGHFIGQAPIAGWENHAIHITDWRYILEFFQINGFNVVTWWMTTANGAVIDPPVVTRNGGKSLLLWYVVKRLRDLGSEPWRKPSQVYTGGVKPS